MQDEIQEKASNVFIKHIHLENYKSIKTLDIGLTNLNVLIGANGAGKSNFISFFALLQQMLKENLRGYVMDKGGQETFLYYGVKQSDYLAAKITVVDEGKEVNYAINLKPTNEGVFRFAYEKLWCNIPSAEIDSYIFDTDNKGFESVIQRTNDSATARLENGADIGDLESDVIMIGYVEYGIRSVQVFHFHDTSDKSPLKAIVANNDNLFLRSDGSNIAGMLKLIHDKHNDYYRLIVETIRMVVPDFHDFVIRNDEFVTLEWFNKKNIDIPWKAHYLSDGSLRFIALAVLLLMPSELQPQTIIIDEPELGLHPSAINILSGLIKRAALERQVIVSTQSTALLSNLEPQDIIIVDIKDNASQFKRLDNDELKSWLQDFSLPQLWEMNILGGRP